MNQNFETLLDPTDPNNAQAFTNLGYMKWFQPCFDSNPQCEPISKQLDDFYAPKMQQLVGQQNRLKFILSTKCKQERIDPKAFQVQEMSWLINVMDPFTKVDTVISLIRNNMHLKNRTNVVLHIHNLVLSDQSAEKLHVLAKLVSDWNNIYFVKVETYSVVTSVPAELVARIKSFVLRHTSNWDLISQLMPFVEKLFVLQDENDDNFRSVWSESHQAKVETLAAKLFKISSHVQKITLYGFTNTRFVLQCLNNTTRQWTNLKCLKFRDTILTDLSKPSNQITRRKLDSIVVKYAYCQVPVKTIKWIQSNMLCGSWKCFRSEPYMDDDSWIEHVVGK